MNQDNTQTGVLANDKGISNNTIAVLVVLALLITVIGTWAVISNINAEKQPIRSSTNVGVMSLTILPTADLQDTNNGQVVSENK